MVDTLEGRAAIQRELDRQEKRATGNSLHAMRTKTKSSTHDGLTPCNGSGGGLTGWRTRRTRKVCGGSSGHQAKHEPAVYQGSDED